MVSAWMSTPATSAAVIRFVLSELGPEFTGQEACSSIVASGHEALLDPNFVEQVSMIESTMDKDQLLDIFYEYHSDDLPKMPGQITERAKKEVPRPKQGSCGESYEKLGTKAQAISENRVFRAMIGILIVGVVLITGMDANSPRADEAQPSQTWMATAEAIIIVVFVSEVILKVVAHGLRPWRFFLISPLPGVAPYSLHGSLHTWIFNIRIWFRGIQGWNIFDLAVVIGCVIEQVDEGGGSNMVILRMIRLIKVLQLFMEINSIRAVLVGLADGLHSLIFILLVFSVIFYVYGLVGIHLFGVSDEFHFSTMLGTFVTMSRMAMGPWQDVMFINLYGCLDDKAHLGTPQIKETYCGESEHRGLAAIDFGRQTAVILYFLTFKVICGFVALSLLFGVITTAMAKALAQTNQQRFDKLKAKRQESAKNQVLNRRNAARLEAEVDIVQRYAVKWWSITGKIEITLEKVENARADSATGRLRRVHVTKGIGLALSDGSADKPKPGDSYVMVYWNDDMLYRSGIVYSSVNPEWTRSAIVTIPPGGGVLRVEVFDWDADEPVMPGISRCDAFQGEATLTLGKDKDSLGGPNCSPESKLYDLTEHVVLHTVEADHLAEAAEVAAVPPDERSDSQLQAVCKVLQSIRWFEINCSNPTALAQVSKCVKQKFVAKDDVLYTHGANAKSMFIVFSGNVLLKQPGGKVVARMGAGATLGERALMGDMDELMDDIDLDSDNEYEIDASKRYCTAVATCDTVVGRLGRKEFLRIPNRRLGAADTTGCMLTYKTYSLHAYNMVNQDWFHWTILVCILIQGIVLGLETTVRSHELIIESHKPLWVFVNITLRLIFTWEVIVKILANLNPWQHWSWFKDVWTLFDTAIVILSWLPFTPQGLLILRVLRLFRVLKEFNSLPQLQMIVNGLIDAVTGLWFVMLLLSLILYFYSIIGLQLFGANDYRFSSLNSALLALCSVATEGSWPKMMYTNMYGCRDYYTPGHRCCTGEDQLGADPTPFGRPQLVLFVYIFLVFSS